MKKRKIVITITEEDALTGLEAVRLLLETRLGKRIPLEEVCLTILTLTGRRIKQDDSILPKRNGN